MDHVRAMDQIPPLNARRRRTRYRRVLLLASLLGVLAAGTGCEESVDPIVGSDVPFTIWGFLNAGADTQYVRVFAVSDQLIPDPTERLDARVFSTDLTTGDRREWTYMTVRFDSLISGHIFWSPFRARHDHRYRLEVIRSDGETTSVQVTVPPEANVDIEVQQGEVVVPVLIRGEVPNLVGFRVTYHAVNIPPMLAWPQDTRIAGAVQLPVTIVYDNLVAREGDAWRIEIDMKRDYDVVHRVYELNCLVTLPWHSAPDVWLQRMEFTTVSADSSWAPPGGVFDPNVLSVPGTFTNVENGYGFFGAGLGIRLDWSPQTEISLAAGFNFEPKCQGLFPQDIPECRNPPVPCVDENLRDLWQIWLR